MTKTPQVAALPGMTPLGLKTQTRKPIRPLDLNEYQDVVYDDLVKFHGFTEAQLNASPTVSTLVAHCHSNGVDSSTAALNVAARLTIEG